MRTELEFVYDGVCISKKVNVGKTITFKDTIKSWKYIDYIHTFEHGHKFTTRIYKSKSGKYYLVRHCEGCFYEKAVEVVGINWEEVKKLTEEMFEDEQYQRMHDRWERIYEVLNDMYEIELSKLMESERDEMAIGEFDTLRSYWTDERDFIEDDMKEWQCERIKAIFDKASMYE